MPTLQTIVSEANDKLLRERLRRKGDISRIVNAALTKYFMEES
jgi:hypothetical protein